MNNDNISLVKEAKTINELSHVFHTKIVNDEKYYHSIVPIAVKKNNSDELIRLLGNKNNLAKKFLIRYQKN